MSNQNVLLRTARLKKQWTMEFVCERVGVPLNTYRQWELGLQIPRPPLVVALCDVFCMKPEDLGLPPYSNLAPYLSRRMQGGRQQQSFSPPEARKTREAGNAQRFVGAREPEGVRMVNKPQENPSYNDPRCQNPRSYDPRAEAVQRSNIHAYDEAMLRHAWEMIDDEDDEVKEQESQTYEQEAYQEYEQENQAYEQDQEYYQEEGEEYEEEEDQEYGQEEGEEYEEYEDEDEEGEEYEEYEDEEDQEYDQQEEYEDEDLEEHGYSEPVQEGLLNLLRRDLIAFWQRYYYGQQSALENEVSQFVYYLQSILDAHPGEPDILVLTSLAFQLWSLLALQKRDFVNAQQHANQALMLSQQSGDGTIYTIAQVRLAYIYSWRRWKLATVRVLENTLSHIHSFGGEVSIAIHSWIFACIGEAQACLGREKEALQYLQLAGCMLPGNPTREYSYSYTHYDSCTLYFYEALLLLRLGRPSAAWSALEKVDTARPTPPERIRAELMWLKAYISCQLENMTQSCIYLEAAAKLVLHMESDLLFNEVYSLFEYMLSIWGQEPRVQSLMTIFWPQAADES